MKSKISLLDRIKAYKLGARVVIACILFTVFVILFFVYQLPSVRADEIADSLVLALFTSILVSVITLIVDIVVEFNRCKNDEYLLDLRKFGIGNLYLNDAKTSPQRKGKNKEEVLRTLLQNCKREIWISGYRLFLTERLKDEIRKAIAGGADFKAVICPPWSDAYKLVYGDDEDEIKKVLDNYRKVFLAVSNGRKEARSNHKAPRVEIGFVEKPLFSDIYRVDSHLLSGPYIYGKEATDFFSYDVVRESELSRLIEEEYSELCRAATRWINWEKFDAKHESITECNAVDLICSLQEDVSERAAAGETEKAIN